VGLATRVVLLAALSTGLARADDTQALDAVAGPIGFRCLPAGTVQRFTNGGSIIWQGAEPGRDDICIGRTGNGEPVAKARGIWAVSPEVPDSMEAIRAAMAALTTGRPGSVVSFAVSAAPPATPNRRFLHFAVHVAGQGAATLAAGLVAFYVIEGEEHGEGADAYRGTVRIWLDRASLALLKWETTDLRTGGTDTSETASLSPPR
jgi:hypothetical protein